MAAIDAYRDLERVRDDLKSMISREREAPDLMNEEDRNGVKQLEDTLSQIELKLKAWYPNPTRSGAR